MASDRFIWFKGEHKVPSKDDVESVLKNFFGEGTATLSWGEGRFYATLPGTPSFPFRELPDALRDPFEGEGDRERWIEVYMDTDNIDVMTRGMDEYTNVLAEGIAGMIARYWQGELEDDA